MRPTRGPFRSRLTPQTEAQKTEFEANAPPLCIPCYKKRHAAGSFISRLVFRPNARLKCADCGVCYSDDTRLGRLARRKAA